MTSEGYEEQHLVEIDRLAVTFFTPKGTVRAVRDASLQIRRGEVLGLVGESGCGKSTLAFALMGYLPGTARVDGSILFEGRDIATISPSELRKLRGNRISMVYQDPMTSLNPTMRVGPQIEEVLREHIGLDKNQARQKTAELFASVGLADPERLGRRYPNQLSGGMQQRVVIAMALACEPDLLIMDEPTTGLDVTTEATILDLVVELKKRANVGILYVSHDLGVIARVADRVTVMYSGQTVEQASVRDLFKQPKHPYTAGLLSCVPRPPSEDETEMSRLSSIPGSVFSAEEANVDACLFASRCAIARDSCSAQAPDLLQVAEGRLARCFFWEDVKSDMWQTDEPEERPERSGEELETVLEASALRQFYGKGQKKYIFFGPIQRRPVRAVVDVDFKVKKGRTLGVVGESGSGKSTIARAIVGLTSRTGGDLLFRGEPLPPTLEDRTREQRSGQRMVFQNPTASLNPKLPVRHTIVRALQKFGGLSKRESLAKAAELLQSVGLEPAYLDRLPGQMSGGQQQRIAIANAFAANPDLVVADEAVSALDVSVQAQVLNLLEDHQNETGTSYIFISHDLGVVRYVSDDILVMYAGHVAEVGPWNRVFNSPSHPYTEALLSAAPVPDPTAKPTTIRLPGAVPSMREAFTGCFFAGRCPRKIGDICDKEPPPARQNPKDQEHAIYCHIPLDELAELQSAGGVQAEA